MVNNITALAASRLEGHFVTIENIVGGKTQCRSENTRSIHRRSLAKDHTARVHQCDSSVGGDISEDGSR